MRPNVMFCAPQGLTMKQILSGKQNFFIKTFTKDSSLNCYLKQYRYALFILSGPMTRSNGKEACESRTLTDFCLSRMFAKAPIGDEVRSI